MEIEMANRTKKKLADYKNNALIGNQVLTHMHARTRARMHTHTHTHTLAEKGSVKP